MHVGKGREGGPHSQHAESARLRPAPLSGCCGPARTRRKKLSALATETAVPREGCSRLCEPHSQLSTAPTSGDAVIDGAGEAVAKIESEPQVAAGMGASSMQLGPAACTYGCPDGSLLRRHRRRPSVPACSAPPWPRRGLGQQTRYKCGQEGEVSADGHAHHQKERQRGEAQADYDEQQSHSRPPPETKVPCGCMPMFSAHCSDTVSPAVAAAVPPAAGPPGPPTPTRDLGAAGSARTASRRGAPKLLSMQSARAGC